MGRGPAARLAGLGLLGLSFAAGASGLYFGVFVDEGDKLLGGWLVAEGAVLYRDFFAHHFPFPYYWLAGAFRLLGPTVLAARLATLVFNLIAWAVLARFTGRPVLVGVAAVGWGALGHLFGAHLALYNSLAASALAVVLGLGLSALTTDSAPARPALFMLGLYAALAILSDLTLAVGVAGVFTLLALRPRVRARLTVALAGLALPLAAWAGYLLASGSGAAAYDSLVRFNVEVYNRYYQLSAAQWLGALARNALSGLYIWKPAFWQLSAAAFGPAEHITINGRWLFGGFLFRAAVLLACGLLLIRRRWLAALLVYGLAVLTATRAEAWFRLQPFALLALVATALVLGLWLEKPVAAGAGVRRLAHSSAAVLMLGLAAWPIARGLGSLVQLRARLAYPGTLSGPLSQAAHIRALSEVQPAALGVYPGDPLLNFLTGLKPVDGVMYLWPWVAEERQAAVIAALEAEPAVVYLNVDGEVWGRPVAVFLGDLHAYLEENYVNIEQSYYISPRLRPHAPP